MKMKFVFLTSFLLFSISPLSAQDLDKEFPEVNFHRLLEFEQQHADSIDRNPAAKKYYARVAHYRFSAVFTGEKRPVDATVLASMKRVFKIFVGNPNQLNEMVKNEYGFQVDDKLLWMPIQFSLEKAFNKELKRGKSAKLYCLFLNEHGLKRQLYNTFLISEFKKEE